MKFIKQTVLATSLVASFTAMAANQDATKTASPTDINISTPSLQTFNPNNDIKTVTDYVAASTQLRANFEKLYKDNLAANDCFTQFVDKSNAILNTNKDLGFYANFDPNTVALTVDGKKTNLAQLHDAYKTLNFYTIGVNGHLQAQGSEAQLLGKIKDAFKPYFPKAKIEEKVRKGDDHNNNTVENNDYSEIIYNNAHLLTQSQVDDLNHQLDTEKDKAYACIKNLDFDTQYSNITKFATKLQQSQYQQSFDTAPAEAKQDVTIPIFQLKFLRYQQGDVFGANHYIYQVVTHHALTPEDNYKNIDDQLLFDKNLINSGK